MKKGHQYLLRVVIGLLFVAGFSATAASTEFYRGKTLRIVVGYSPGGGYDTYARVIARHLKKHIPGEPRMIVENRPGAGGLISANHVYNSERQDGTTILHVGGSVIFKQFAGFKNVKYDVTKFQYIGGVFTVRSVMVVTKKTGINRFESLLSPGAKEIALGGISTGSPQDVAAVLLRDIVGARVRLVTGYRGSARIRLAMEAGELDGMVISWNSLRVTSGEKISSGEWLLLLRMSEDAIPGLPNVPSVLKFTENDEQRGLIRLTTLVPYKFARPLILGPGVPEDRVRILRKAFERTMTDRNFLGEVKKADLAIDPISGPKLRSFVLEFMTMPAQPKAKVLKLLAPGKR
jgi:tripartite-type tricarboxylate transporter receptor subunit TctC